jgi:hypothetical protein
MDKFTATNVLNKRAQAQRVYDCIARIEKQLDAIRRKRGTTFDALTRDIRTADAKALDAARKHLTGKAPRTADESNHLAALTAKCEADVQRAQAINEANAQRGINGLLAKALAAMK